MNVNGLVMASPIIDPLRISLKPRARDVFKLFLFDKVLSRKKIEEAMGIKKSWACRLLGILKRYGLIRAAYPSLHAPYQHYVLNLVFWFGEDGDNDQGDNVESGEQPP